MPITFEPIGVIHSPYTEIGGMPIQPAGAAGVTGSVKVFPQFQEGLADLDGFSHIILLYHFHQVQAAQLTVKPFLDDETHGVFATRAPKRPNPIGLSVVRLVGLQAGTLTIEGVDVLDGTPLLDLKPFIPSFDQPEVTRIGWLAKSSANLKTIRSDERFRD